MAVDSLAHSITLTSLSVKILVLANLYPPHHAGTFDFRCQTTTEALRLRGHTIHVLTSRHGMSNEQRGGEIERRLFLNGVYDHPRVARLGELRPLETDNNRILRETLEAFQPDVIHVHSLGGLSKSLVFALRHSHRPTVYDVADYWMAKDVGEDPWLKWWNRPRGPLHHTLWRAVLEAWGRRNKLDALAPTRMMKGYERVPQVYGDTETPGAVEPNSIAAFRFDRLYFCSRALKEATLQAGFRVDHAEVIYPGIPTQNFVGEIKPAKAPTEKLLVVARLDAHSGAMTAVRALRMLLANQIRATLSIYGKGDSAFIAELRSYIAQHQLPVEFLNVSNVHKELPAIYRRHDALLYTAEWNEPFSTTPLEAMASGVPVIGTTIGGAQELLRHGENALTYPSGDAVMLATRVQELQMQPALRCQMAETAQQEVLSKYNETVVADQVENYLQSSLESWVHEAT
jgi:glycosyltransferase involved in cell wall biosynthesis